MERTYRKILLYCLSAFCCSQIIWNTQLSFLYLLILQFFSPPSLCIYLSFILRFSPFSLPSPVFFTQHFQIFSIEWVHEKSHRTTLESFMWIKPCTMAHCQGTQSRNWMESACSKSSLFIINKRYEAASPNENENR